MTSVLFPRNRQPTKTPTVTNPQTNLASRLWQRDASLWQTPADSVDAISTRLGWLDSIGWMRNRAGELQKWAAAIAASGDYERVILLGMGGSSLAPAVFASLFAPAPGYPPLTVLDTTNPGDIARISGGDLRRCLFVVASKSGDTIETVSLYRFFRAQLACPDPSSRFVLITDDGSALHRPAEYSRVFINPADIGGRYSALSYFGLAPAALLGVDVEQLLARAQCFCETTRSDDPRENPALALGTLLGRGALAGRDKLILRLPDELRAFGLWVEQLVAESTGKDGKGLVPVLMDAGEEADFGGGDDRITVNIGYGGGGESANETNGADHALPIDDPYQIGAEFFRWEVATAIAACYLRVNPFDQPAVAQAKARTRVFLRGEARVAAPSHRGDAYDLYYPGAGGEPDTGRSASQIIAEFHRTLGPKNYLALLAYLPEDEPTLALMHSLRRRAAERFRIATTLGIGPRYLHSTGQLHKDGPPTGRFIQLVAHPDGDDDGDNDAPVPDCDYTFGQLYRAQADGDFSVLAARAVDGGGGAVMRVALKADRLRALAAFVSEFVSEFAAPE